MSSDNLDKTVLRIVKSQASVSDSHEAEALAQASANVVCEFCFGTGTRLEPNKGAVLCECRRTNRKANLLMAARIPKRFQARSFGNYYPKNESQSFAHNYAKSLVDHYPAVDKGLLLMGGVGVGKTHLAIAIIRTLIETKGVPCLFYESGSLLKAIQESYSPISQTSEMRVLAPVFEAEVLVLDELGATVPSDWVRDTLYQIINTRYNNNRLTIFTTNYLDEVYVKDELRALKLRLEALKNGEYNSAKTHEEKEIKKQVDELEATKKLENRIGVTLRSRLYEMCGKIEIKGQDYRKGL
jgi:DNA replication protein DnaC